MAISLDAYRLLGKTTDRVVVADNDYLNSRFLAYCPVCDKERLHDPVNTARKCCSCDFLHKDTDLGVMTFTDHWIRW